MRALLRLMGCAVILAVGAASAAAQVTRPTGMSDRDPPPLPHAWEVAGGITWAGPVDLGSVDATLVAPSGSPFTLFRTSNEIRQAVGIEVHLLNRLAPRVDAELTGTFTRADVETRVFADVEDVPDATLTAGLNRYTVEGSVLWRFKDGERTTSFLRGGVGWMRELDSEESLVENGVLLHIGGGVKYWFQPTSAATRFGVRVEVRALARKDGIRLGDDSIRIGPVIAASAVIGF